MATLAGTVVLACTVVPTGATADTALAAHQGRGAGSIADIEDIVAEVESMDGAESESKRGRTVTVGIASDVLFALDNAEVSAKARGRLTKVAERIENESAGGPIRIKGHTDDQGGDAYNDKLSLRRAHAVSHVLEGLVPGRNLSVRGLGESDPKLPNIVDGDPIEENRAKNRRVEIIFEVER